MTNDQRVCYSEKHLNHDNYLVPYAMVELGLLQLGDGRVDAAIDTLNKAKSVAIGF